ncbi:hypothetical protein [Bosea sp. 117]|uniref:hypothetical protein n=1 Tax=Bosea sp. 117 TaxID=1125973 RepID=UPI000494C8EC|nr:hypothetical protein [Bosea sp. 117]
MNPEWRARACYVAAAALCLAYIFIVPSVDLIDICAGAGLGAAAMWALNDWETVAARRTPEEGHRGDAPARRPRQARSSFFARRRAPEPDPASDGYEAYGDPAGEPEDFAPRELAPRRQEHRPEHRPAAAQTQRQAYPDDRQREERMRQPNSLLARAYEEFHRTAGRQETPRPDTRDDARREAPMREPTRPRAWERDLPPESREREPAPREPARRDPPASTYSSGRTAPNPPRPLRDLTPPERPDPREGIGWREAGGIHPDDLPRYEDARESERLERYRALTRRTEDYLSGTRRDDAARPYEPVSLRPVDDRDEPTARPRAAGDERTDERAPPKRTLRRPSR